MAHEAAAAPPRRDSRRTFLYGATAAMGAVGLAAAAWPLIHQMNPDAATRARGDTTEVDAAALQPADLKVVKWRLLPVFVMRRTPAVVAALSTPAFVAALRDPQSTRRQQGDYVRNAYRSIDPAIAVLVGVCTKCACVPKFFAEDAATADAFICPCCASHYDAAGRAAAGPAPYNLPVPPYSLQGSRILIGRNPPGEVFSFSSIEGV